MRQILPPNKDFREGQDATLKEVSAINASLFKVFSSFVGPLEVDYSPAPGELVMFNPVSGAARSLLMPKATADMVGKWIGAKFYPSGTSKVCTITAKAYPGDYIDGGTTITLTEGSVSGGALLLCCIGIGKWAVCSPAAASAGANLTAVAYSDAGDYSSSAVWVSIPALVATLTDVTTPLLFIIQIAIENDDPINPQELRLGYVLDGGLPVMIAQEIMAHLGTANMNTTIVFPTGLGAGAHTLQIQFYGATNARVLGSSLPSKLWTVY